MGNGQLLKKLFSDAAQFAFLLAIFFVLQVYWRQRFVSKLRVIENFLNRIGRRQWLAIIMIGSFSFLLSLSFTVRNGMPQPEVHDEFSYLLAADTFAHARLTNPPHPMWEHLESFHVIQQPTYASKYPPMQGLFMALGLVLTGYPIVGVWLSVAMACAAIYWMLVAWVKPKWAVLGGVLIALHPLPVLWSQNYWGGAVAMFGGALLLGSVRHTMQTPCLKYSLLLGCALVVLATSRPYEGFVLGLLAFATFVFWISASKKIGIRILLKNVLTPILIILVLAGWAMAAYNRAVTGNAFRMPYMAHLETYEVSPLFVWQSLRPEPYYRHKELQDFYVGYGASFYKMLSVSAVTQILTVKTKTITYFMEYVEGLILGLPLIILPLVLPRNRRVLCALLLIWVFMGSISLIVYYQTRYAAPIFGAIMLLLLQTIPYLRSWSWRKYRIGICLSRAWVMYALIGLLTLSVTRVQGQSGWACQRDILMNSLKHDGGQHLIIVRYDSTHSVLNEWVYNEADIDKSKVVWARDMGVEKNKELIDYFKDRKIWLLRPGENPPRLIPYEEGMVNSGQDME